MGSYVHSGKFFVRYCRGSHLGTVHSFPSMSATMIPATASALHRGVFSGQKGNGIQRKPTKQTCVACRDRGIRLRCTVRAVPSRRRRRSGLPNGRGFINSHYGSEGGKTESQMGRRSPCIP